MTSRLTAKDLAVAHDTLYGALYTGKCDLSAFNYDKFTREETLDNIDAAMRCLKIGPIAELPEGENE